MIDAAWQRLAALATRPGATAIRAHFAADPDRARRFTATFDDLTLDFSKTSIDSEALVALLDLAHAAGVGDFRRRLFAGEAVNATEGRAAMHMALRAPADAASRTPAPWPPPNARSCAPSSPRSTTAPCAAPPVSASRPC